jgi:ABC-type uncharacterized transport system substrate-binding protein
VCKAGAFAALYIDSTSIGQQAARLAKDIALSKKWTPGRLFYPVHVSRAINERTADMIEIPIPDHVANQLTIRYSPNKGDHAPG